MPTVQDICTRAAQYIGAVQSGEPLETQELTDIQAALNALLDSESIQRDSIYRVSKSDRYTLIPGTQDYTFGAGGTMSVTRPDFISSINLVVASPGATNEITQNLQKLEDEDWQALSMPNFAASYPTAYYVDYAYPLLTISFYPTPTVARSFDVYTGEALPRTVNASDNFIFPKGYERFIVSNLALEIAPMFPGSAITPQLMKIADDSRNAVREYNRKEPPRLYTAHQLRHGVNEVDEVRIRSMWS